MKIHGVEGMSAENIRDEVNRGGRLVIFTYCISILVMTFKRPAGIRLIKAGHNPAAASWPWVAISFVFGWWGFPWGPIYTIETIYRNLCGGIDVTDDVLREILPPPALAHPKAATPVAAPVPTAPLLHTPPAPARGFNLKAAGLMAGAVCLITLLGLSVYCFQQKQDLTVVLASGLNKPYSVVLNGQTYQLGPYDAQVLHLPEGEFNLQDAPGSKIVGAPQAFTFSIPFFSHLGTSKVAIINPDRAAILLNAEVPYYNKNSTPPANEDEVYGILANQPSYFIAKPDYVIEKAEENISMPAGTTRLVKTRLDNLRGDHLEWVLGKLVEKNGYPAARDHVMIVARYESDEEFLNTALGVLKAPDMPAFFQLRLAERPVLVDWHRFYQRSREVNEPAHDIVQEYRDYLKAEPGNGALMYLLGRQTIDEDEAQRLWAQAINASAPCAYAYGAMGYDAMSDGRFAEALTAYLAAEKAGLSGASRKAYRREAMWALGQPDALLTELADARKSEPLDYLLAEEEIRATLAFRHDETAAQKLKAAYLKAYAAGGASKEYVAQADAYLQLSMAYQLQDWNLYARKTAEMDSTVLKFSAACSQGDHKHATEALLALSEPSSESLLELYLLDQRAGDTAAAEAHFQKALEVMKTESAKHRRLVSLLTASAPDPQAICAVRISVDQKRVLLTALGLRHPENQAVYFDLARKLNFKPEFPYHLLRPILGQTL